MPEEEVPIPIEEQRNNKIKGIARCRKREQVYLCSKRQVGQKFLDLVEEREATLAKAKKDLANEKIRNDN